MTMDKLDDWSDFHHHEEEVAMMQEEVESAFLHQLSYHSSGVGDGDREAARSGCKAIARTLNQWSEALGLDKI